MKSLTIYPSFFPIYSQSALAGPRLQLVPIDYINPFLTIPYPAVIYGAAVLPMMRHAYQ